MREIKLNLDNVEDYNSLIDYLNESITMLESAEENHDIQRVIERLDEASFQLEFFEPEWAVE